MLKHKKIRVALIYGESNVFLTGKYFDNVYYNFFIKSLSRNEQIIVTNFPTKKTFDASILKNNFDIILLWSNSKGGMPQELKNIDKLDIPVIARAADPSDAKSAVKFHKEWKINYYFHFLHESFFYDLYPSNDSFCWK